MSEQTLKRLVGALVVVAALWGVAALLSGDRDERPMATGEIVGFFDGVSEVSATAVRMTTPTGETELTGGLDDWQVNGYQADSAIAFRFWAAVASLEIGEVAATNPANHHRMGVSSDSAWTLEFDLGGTSKTLLVGSQGPRFGTSFVRLPDEDEVYVLEGDMRTHMRRLLNEWRNKTVSRIDTDPVTRVAIERDGESYTIVKSDTLWTFEDGSPTNATTARGVMAELRQLLAVGFLEEGDSLAAHDQGAMATAYDAAGNVLQEIRIGSGDDDRWARAAGDSITYRIGLFRVDRIAPTRESMEPSTEG